MQIDTAGTYTLKYTAEDACGNITEIEREVEAVQISYRTVLYTDGTFIINEKSTDISSNVARHGEAINIYYPLGNYSFTNEKTRPWHAQSSQVTAVEIGTPIQPTRTAYWFSGFANCTQMNLENLDTSAVTDMYAMFSGCRKMGVLDLSHFDTSGVTDMSFMFNYTSFDELVLTSFDTSGVRKMQSMFRNCQIDMLDISSFVSPSTGDIDAKYMFERTEGRSIKKIIATDAFGSTVTPHTGDMANIFAGCYDLVGGAGTAWSLSHEDDWAYARIDNPPDAPGYFTAKTSA